MKQISSIFTFCLVALSFVACSSFLNKTHNHDTENLVAKPLALATEAYELLNGDEKSLVTYDLERAYFANATTQTLIKRSLKKYKEAKTSDAKDSEMETLVEVVLDKKKPDFKKALTFAKNIKKPETKSEILLRIAKDMPKNKRLPVLYEAEKAIAKINITKFVYKKRSKLLKLAKMYFDLGDKQNARRTILSSHKLLIRNASSSNAIDFGTVAELESQLGIHPNTLCKLTNFLHKSKDRPIALARITAAYMNHGYQDQVCMTDKELIAAIRNMPDIASQVRQQLILAEAMHVQKKQDKSEQLYKSTIKSVKLVNPLHYQLDTQTKILISLKKTANKKLFNYVSKNYWKQVNKQSSYEQSNTLMQLVMEAYDVEGLIDLSLDALSKMKDNSLKATTGIQLARAAHKKNNQRVAKQAFIEAFLAAKTTPYLVPKMDWLRNVIDSAYAQGNSEIVQKALNASAKSVARVTYPDLKVMYANLLIEQAWEHKDFHLAQELLKKNQLWYGEWIKKPRKTKKGTHNAIDYTAENKRTALIDLIKNNVLLGNNTNVIVLLNKLPNQETQTKALVYIAITLTKKRKKQGITKKDDFMLKTLENNIKRIRRNMNQKNKT